MKSEIILVPTPDELEIDELLTLKRDIHDNFIYSLPEVINLKVKDYIKFINEIKLKIGEYSKFDYSSNKNKIYYKITGEKYKIYVVGNSKEVKCTIYASNEATANSIWLIYVKNLELDSNVKIFVDNFYIGNNGLTNNSKQLKEEDIEYISTLYYPYININVMFDQFFTGAENILLCVGQPGVGKSKLATLALKYAVKNSDKIPYDKFLQGLENDAQYINVVLVKGADVLSKDSFWNIMEEEPPDFVIIDDLDYMLTKRSADVQSSDDQLKNNFLNQFLSFTDGVEKHKSKFIITTNQNYDEIDTALLRKGRLFDILELRELQLHEALDIWKSNKLHEETFFKIFKENSVLPAELGSEISKRLNKRIKNSTEKYLKEDNISKLKRAKRTKRITL